MPRSFINSALVVLAVGAGLVNAAPVELASTATPTLLSSSTISAFTPYSWYASAGYCNPSATLAWNCGANCQGNPQFIPVASGGDGFVQQYWFVGYDPTFKSVIVSHQGTNPNNIIPLLTDGNFALKNLDSTLFPGLSSSLQAHSGFLGSHALSAPSVLAAVQKTMAQYKTTSVTMTGHSLGAALALLDSIYLPLHLPSTTTFKTVGYGLPRVGNPAFAAYVDSSASKVHLTHVNNMKDPVPILPGRGLGFAHPSGEVHIQSVGNWYSCPGEDNTSGTCEIGDVPNILVADLDNHDGPYGPVTMGCSEDN